MVINFTLVIDEQEMFYPTQDKLFKMFKKIKMSLIKHVMINNAPTNYKFSKITCYKNEFNEE